jgi:hypothetical protein
MKKSIIVCIVLLFAGMAFAQSFTLVKNEAISGKNGICIGYDPVNNKAIRSSFGNPPVIDVLNRDTLAIESALATGSTTWGALGAFGMGVASNGNIIAMDHIEDSLGNNGLVRWNSISDTNPGLCTPASSVPFPRYITILGTGTDRLMVCSAKDSGGPLTVLTTTDGNLFSLAYSVGGAAPEYGGQRGSAAYVGTGTNTEPQYIFGCDAHSQGQADGIHVHERVGSAYVFQGDMDPTSAESNDAILGIAVDPGFAATEGVPGEKPVLIALGFHSSVANKTALYMFNLETMQEIAVLPFTPASANIGFYGALALDTENKRVYFSIRNSGDSSLGYADYTVPTYELPMSASNWNLYE